MKHLQHIIVMGVSGAGKTTTGLALAAKLGWPFLEGDGFHPAANLQKMAAGMPLSDADRRPWLTTLAAKLAEAEAAGQSTVLSCSALRRAYRDILRRAAPQVRFLHVHGAHALLAGRLTHREGHFFPAKLLASQLSTLEPLAPDEDGIVVDMALSPEDQVADAVARLGLSGARPD